MEEAYTDDPLDCAFIEMEQPKGWQSGTSDKALLRHRGLVREAGIRMPLVDKIKHAQKVITSAFQREGESWAVSYSGGADSTVLSHLIIKLGHKVPHVFADTRLEHEETRRQIRRWRRYAGIRGCPVDVVRSEKKPPEVWDTVGVPLFSKMIASKIRQYQKTGNAKHLKYVPEKYHAAIEKATQCGIVISEKCCNELKKKPMKEYDKKHKITGHFTGVRASEARTRKLAWLQRGALYHSKRNDQWLAHPLIYWTKEDVCAYLDINHVPFVPRKEGKRSGCVVCGFGCHLLDDDDMNDIQHLHLDKPKLWKAMVASTDMEHAMRLLGIESNYACRSDIKMEEDG